MATKKPAIVGSIIQNGRIFKAGDEDALAKVLPQSDIDRHVKSGQLTGNWGGKSESEENESATGAVEEPEAGAPASAETPAPTAEPAEPAEPAPAPKAAKKARKRAPKKGR